MLVIASAVVVILLALALAYAASRPYLILYALAALVSIVGINIHLGVTLYFSRICVMVFFVSILIRAPFSKRVHFRYGSLAAFLLLFGLIISFQLVSAGFSDQVADSIRQVFIYISAMTVFLVVVVVGDRVDRIVKAIKIYLAVGLVQGLYGLYQLVGYTRGWPTYQTLMAGIPRANDQTAYGYIYSSALSAFRATGFFPADVSHYAGYMVGILLLAIALVAYNRRSVFPYLVLLFGGAGLLFSLSRSGIAAFFLFGLPSLWFLLARASRSARRLRRSVVRASLFLLAIPIIGALIAPQIPSSWNVSVPDVGEIVSRRLDNVLNPEAGGADSAGEHIMTKLTGLDAFASSPLIGVGLGVHEIQWYSEYYHRGWGGSHSHHLDALGQTGIIGAVLQLLFMAIVGMYMWRGLFATRDQSPERHVLAGLLASYVAIVFGNFLYHYFLIDFVWFLMGCGVALSRLLILDARRRAGNQSARIAESPQPVGVSP